jgi:hypothetical protein
MNKVRAGPIDNNNRVQSPQSQIITRQIVPNRSPPINPQQILNGLSIGLPSTPINTLK